MVRRFAAGAGAAALLMLAAPAQAGVFSDGLARCVVTAAQDGDRTTIMKWLFAAMAANPQIAPMANVTQAERDELTRQFAQISERLLMSDCRTEAVQAIKNEGPGVVEAVFRVLGESAMRSLMTDPATAAAMTAIDQFTDKTKWAELMREAGLTSPPEQQPQEPDAGEGALVPASRRSMA